MIWNFVDSFRRMITKPQLQSAPMCGRLLVVSFVAYAACLPMVAFCVRPGSCDVWTSGKVLIYGWMGMLLTLHSSHFIWLANPALLIAWLLIAFDLGEAASNGTPARKAKAVLVSGLALLLAAAFLLPVGIVDNEGGVSVSIMSREAGYWLWLTSILCAFASAVFLPVQAASTTNVAR